MSAFPHTQGQDETKSSADVKVGFMAKTGNLREKLLLSPTLQTLRRLPTLISPRFSSSASGDATK